MSALPPKADMRSALAHVCYGPKSDIGDFGQWGGYVPVPFSMTVRLALIVEANWFIKNASI
jgi:hypothetical protein